MFQREKVVGRVMTRERESEQNECADRIPGNCVNSLSLIFMLAATQIGLALHSSTRGNIVGHQNVCVEDIHGFAYL